jgi:hypothetical protein
VSQPVAECTAVAIGDSCVLHYCNGALLTSFPRKTPEEFDAFPVCLPSQGYRAAWWQNVGRRELQIRTGDVVILATDAVSKWLLAGSDDLRQDRFDMLREMSDAHWPGFLDALRSVRKIQDDDSTAVIITVTEVTGDFPKAYETQTEVREARQLKLKEAYERRDFLEMAAIFGSGEWQKSKLTFEGTPILEHPRIREARSILEGRRVLLEALGRFTTTRSKDIGELQRLWNIHRDALAHSELVAGMRRTLERLGVRLGHPVAEQDEAVPGACRVVKEAEEPKIQPTSGAPNDVVRNVDSAPHAGDSASDPDCQSPNRTISDEISKADVTAPVDSNPAAHPDSISPTMQQIATRMSAIDGRQPDQYRTGVRWRLPQPWRPQMIDLTPLMGRCRHRPAGFSLIIIFGLLVCSPRRRSLNVAQSRSMSISSVEMKHARR